MFFKTADLYLAAYLRVVGVKFQGTFVSDGKVYFLFEEGQVSFKEYRRQYFSDTVRVPVLSYVQSVRFFKDLIPKSL